jgi:hypothetical protein
MARVPDLNVYLDRIIAGQQDDTIPPGVATATAKADAELLYNEINALIDARNSASKEREQQRQEETRAEMNAAQREIERQEDINMMNNINLMLARSNGRLSRSQRIALNNLIMDTISRTITNYEIKQELGETAGLVERNIRDLFNALIQYYTEMASYGYQRAPDILANIGSIVAGTVIIGSAILTPPVGTGGGILITLSRGLGSATATASGLYFLQRGGLPIKPMLRGLGSSARQCITAGCTALINKIDKIVHAGLSSLGEYLGPDYSDFKIDYDARSGNFSVAPSRAPSIASIASSTNSTTSTAEDARSAIDGVLQVSDGEKIQELMEGLTAPPNTVDSLQMFPASAPTTFRRQFEEIPDELILTGRKRDRDERDEGIDPDSQVSDITVEEFGSQDDTVKFAKRFGSEEEVSDDDMGEGDKGGKRARKSRRNTKSKKSRKLRKGRKVRKGRMTKKGRKHHKTLKRYRSKMRR